MKLASRWEGVLLVWSTAVLVFSRLIAYRLFHVFDDAFITFRYARNLALGHGFVYNRNEWVLGTTTPAFGLVNALFYRLGLPLPQTAVFFNIFLDVGIYWLTLYALPKRWRSLSILFVGVLWAAVPSLGRISVGGMEMSLLILGALGALLLFVRGRPYWAILVAALGYAIRPEGVILLGVLCLAPLFSGRRGSGRGIGRALRLGGVGALGVGLSVGLTYFFYGRLLPQSLIAKSLNRPSSTYTVLYHLFGADPFILGLIPLALVGGWFAYKTTRPFTNRFVRIVGVWGGLYTLAYLVGRPQMWPWYGTPIYYALVVLAAVGLVGVSGQFLEHKPNLSTALRRAIPLLSCLPLGVWAAVGVWLGPSGITTRVYAPLEQWCREVDRTGDTFLAADIGAIGYYCDGYIYDLAGLVTPELRRLAPPGAIARYQPDYLFMNAVPRTRRLMEAGPLSREYAPVFAVPETNLDDIAYSPAGWIQHYVIFAYAGPPENKD